MVDTIIPTVKLLEGWKYIKDKKNLFDLLKSIIGATIMFAVLYFLCNRIESNAQKNNNKHGSRLCCICCNRTYSTPPFCNDVCRYNKKLSIKGW